MDAAKVTSKVSRAMNNDKKQDGADNGVGSTGGSPLLTMRAHQYLYYVECRPVISDYDYDLFCTAHGLHGGGGSDRASDYTEEEITHAARLANYSYENEIHD